MAGPERVRSRYGVLARFVALALVWGASFLFIKIGLQGLSAGQVALARLLGGAATLSALMVFRRMPLPRERVVWMHLLVVAVLISVVPFNLFAWAEHRLSSGLASIYNATTPLMTVLVAIAALPQERPTRARVAGLLTGFAGVLVVLGPWRPGTGGDLLAQLACLLATACYGGAFVYLRRFIAPRRLAALPVATVQVGLGTVVALLLSPWLATGPVHLTGAVVGCVLALGVGGTGLAYVWNTEVVSAWGATNASTVTYLTPLVGVVLGVLVLGEHVSWNEPAGAVLVIVGIVISQRRSRSRPLGLQEPADAGQAGGDGLRDDAR